MAAFWLPECRCSPGGFEGLGLDFLGCEAQWQSEEALGVLSAFLGPQRRLRPGPMRPLRQPGFFYGAFRSQGIAEAAFSPALRPVSRAFHLRPTDGWKAGGCCSLVVLPSVPPRTSRCGSTLHLRESPGSNPGSVILFLQFFCCYVLLASFCACLQVCRGRGQPHGYHTRSMLCNRNVEKGRGIDGQLPAQRTRDGVRGASRSR